MIRAPAVMRRHGAVSAGLLAQVLQYGSALALLPFIVTRLSEEQVGIWYIFVTVQGLALLADFGFQPSIARAVAAAFAGATELKTQGLATPGDGAAANLALVYRVVLIARRLYLALAILVLALLATAGTLYISDVARGEDVEQVRIAWLLFALGTAANLYFLWIVPALQGSGRVAQSYLFTIVNRGGFALIGIVVLLAGGGLIALAAANLAGVLMARAAAVQMLRPVTQPLAGISATRQQARHTFAALWPNSWRLGLTALGAFAISRANILIVSSLVGLSASASYALSLQLLSVVVAIAHLPTQAVLPKMIALRVQGDRAGLRRMFLPRQLFLIAVFIVGAGCVWLLGEPLLAAVGSTVHLLPKTEMAVLALVLLLEANHSNCAIVITTGNRVPFVWPSLLSGMGVVALSVAVAQGGGGLLGIILSQCLVQVLYNNWKWPLVLWKELRS